MLQLNPLRTADHCWQDRRDKILLRYWAWFLGESRRGTFSFLFYDGGNVYSSIAGRSVLQSRVRLLYLGRRWSKRLNLWQVFFEYLQFFPQFQIFNLLQFPNIFPLLTIGPAIRANLRKVILNLQHFILKIFHSFFPLNRSDTSFPDISSFLSFLFVVPFSFDYFVTNWGFFFFLTEKINFLSTHLQTDLVPQLFGSLEGYLEQFINIFLIFYLFKHLLPLLYTLLMKFCHFAETSLSLDLERMRVDYIFHL